MTNEERVLDIFARARKVYQTASFANNPHPVMTLPEADIQLLRDLPDAADHMEHVIIAPDGTVRILGVRVLAE